MANVVGVRFKKAGKIYYFDPGELELAVGGHVIVETARGVEFGEVVVGPKNVAEEALVQPLKQVQRRAGADDLNTVRTNAELAANAFATGTEKILAHKLPMKLVDVEYTFDQGKLIFYFTADGRVDFRDLVKDLASIFRTRIELRQIGVRDEAKMIGGIGPCGRSLCCATFLGEFDPVSIRMAKDQNLSLNPGKISGICGRLMCCLRYEAELYREQRAAMPERGAKVHTAGHGPAHVKEVHPLDNTVTLQPEESPQPVKVDADQVEPVGSRPKRRPKPKGSGTRGPQDKKSEKAPAPKGEKPERPPEKKGPAEGQAGGKPGKGPGGEKRRPKRTRRPKRKGGGPKSGGESSDNSTSGPQS